MANRDPGQPAGTRSAPVVVCPPDTVLLNRLAQGDLDALGHVYDRYGRRVYRLAVSLTEAGAPAEDLTCAVFLALVAQCRQGQPPGVPLIAWLVQQTSHRGRCWQERAAGMAGAGQRAPAPGA
jgi:RNA polymerase sigma-70 factor (ECF subfamily)